MSATRTSPDVRPLACAGPASDAPRRLERPPARSSITPRFLGIGLVGLVVAHRLTQAAAADRVIVMEHGRIVENGPHADLVGAGGRYATLWRAWQGRTSA